MTMALISSAGARALPAIPSPGSLSGARRSPSLVVYARKGISSRTSRGESKGKKESPAKLKEEAVGGGEDFSPASAAGDLLGSDGVSSELKPMPELPGLNPSFWEGSKWDAFGFVMQYLWAFGVVFALIACGVAVATYNDGATDFKETTVYKESVQTQDILEDSDSSSSDVFEVNPTEVAPSLE